MITFLLAANVVLIVFAIALTARLWRTTRDSAMVALLVVLFAWPISEAKIQQWSNRGVRSLQANEGNSFPFNWVSANGDISGGKMTPATFVSAIGWSTRLAEACIFILLVIRIQSANNRFQRISDPRHVSCEAGAAPESEIR